MTARRGTMVFALALAAVLAIYLLRLDAVAGLFVDDAWYIEFAESIASGQGYRMINSAAAQVLPAVPPGFAIVLAPIVALVPGFPNYVIWMKLLLVAATLGAGILCWIDFVRNRAIPGTDATLIVVASLLTPALVFLATSSVMAEGVFMLLQVAAAIAVERTSRHDAGDHRSAALAGILSAAAMLVRTTGAALIAAAVVHLVLARRWRQAATFAAVLILCLLPWQLYASAHTPTAEERASHGGTMASTYSRLMTSANFTDTTHAAPVSRLVARATANVRGVFTKDVGGIVVPALYRGADESGQEVFSIGRPEMSSMGSATGTMIASALLTVLAIMGWLGSPRERFAMPALVVAATLPMVAPVTGQTFRYMVPLAPYILMLVWRGLRSGRVARIALLIVVGLHALDHLQYLHQRVTATTPWIAEWHDQQELLKWVTQTVPAGAGIATTNPPLIYLATGRRTVAIDNVGRNWDRWKSSGIRYIVSTRPDSEFPARSLGWRQRFSSSRAGLWAVEMTEK